MKRIAVIAHNGKTLGGGLAELRKILEEQGVKDVFWREVPKSRFAAKQVKAALAENIDLIFVWGGDGMVQRCVDVVTGTDASLAIIPAGTANLLATNLGIPKDIKAAVEIGLAGNLRGIDVGRINGERFAVMAGTGFDARMIGDADGGLKDRVGRLAYIWTGAKNIRQKPFGVKITVDGSKWFDGDASCILLGNVGKLFGGVEAFEDAHPDDGLLELGVVTAEGVREWAGTMVRAVIGTASKSPHAQTTKARSVRIKMDRKVPYEIDGGDRKTVKKLKVDIQPEGIHLCVPVPGPA
ncbi:MAG TPA: YegS/Rv2252/BmrU family lipid kinase [Gaiellales bacterium]|jgi:YegS/Rv2252/BmrU family lipid kinase|nr:YegS/Rv2252/BmrU family lipid kinase [Gaiellales bacterium]